jgi:hypothetical protein
MFPFEELQSRQNLSERERERERERETETEFRIAMEGIVLNWRQFSITNVKQLTRY